MPWWADDPEWWRKGEPDRRVWFPTSEWGERVEAGRRVRYLEVVMTPIPPPEELLLIVADLGRPETNLVQLEPNGRIRHHPRCAGRHELHDERLAHLALPDAAFLLSAALYGPPEHPRVRVIDPEISARTFVAEENTRASTSRILRPRAPPVNAAKWRRH